MLDFDIVDAHHHLCDYSRPYPWLQGPAEPFRYHGDDRPLRRNYLIEDYLDDARGLRLAGSVHIENGAADAIWEADWIQDVHDNSGLPSVQVAKASLAEAGVIPRLERLAAIPSVRGIRDILNWHPDPRYTHTSRPDLITDTQWLKGFSCLSALGLSFDLQVFPAQLDQAAQLAANHPDTTIILDHAGMPIHRDPASLRDWKAGMKHLAKQPNVVTKISALGTNDHSWTTASIRPIVLDTIDVFGPHRTMFGSNFPVDSLYSSFTALYAAFDEITSAMSDDERRHLFAETARKTYGIGPSAAPHKHEKRQ
ncbi:Predicted metal-dependent hydrolase, TIM-barrel fold [Pseudarthrobacter equi]|uniref:Predicted metal-dependent hydrolase, TIM-barrel fold n=1 Tax=Pseudarthrobacter equi TaxID=728066 RepID=A0A1H1TME1_9MICC|nr:amidohydrolase family protein [Pseudarthrobacter equi]SDS61231.1 Predicted metal-dependent hydrolase, TIM-barrel fold [Pseudarthrobacter equi]